MAANDFYVRRKILSVRQLNGQSVMQRIGLSCLIFFSILLNASAIENSSKTETNADTDRVRIFGKISLPDGKAAENATVYLLSVSKGSYTLPTQPLRTQSNNEGMYSFESIELGNYQIWAETSKLTSLEEKLRGKKLTIVEKKDAADTIDLSLHEGCHYSIRVVDKANGKGIPNALISFGGADIERSYPTNEAGEAEIGGLAKDDWHFLVNAEAYAMKQQKTPKQSLGSRTNLLFELEPGTILHGMIRDEHGDAVPQAKVSVSEARAVNLAGLGKSFTDADGKFELNGLPRASSLRLFIDAEGYERKIETFMSTIDGTGVFLNFSVKKRPYGGDCLVTVTDENGRAIPDATVKNQGNSSADVRSAKTNNDGIARVEDVFKGTRGAAADVTAPGFVTQRVSLVTGTKEKPGEVAISLKKGASILGRLLTPDGQPQAKVKVYYNQGERGLSVGGNTDTDKDGFFRLDGLPDPCTFTFYTPAPYAPIRDFRLPVGTGDEIDVVMELEAVLRVRAVDAISGNAIPAFNVKLGFSPDRRKGDPSMSINSNLVDPGTDILGEVKVFRLGQIVPGTPFQVTVSANGYQKTTLRRVEAALENESDVVDVSLTREVEQAFRMVSGYLHDSDGTPIDGAKVQLIVGEDDPIVSKWRDHWTMIETEQIKRQSGCLQFLTTVSKKDGSFRFERVQSARWMEVVHSGGNIANGRHTIVDPATTPNLEDLKLVANRGGSIKVAFRRDDFPEALTVDLTDPRSYDDRTAFSNARIDLTKVDSEIVFPHLPPGDYQVTLNGKPDEVGNGLFRTRSIIQKKAIVEEDLELLIEF